MSYAERPPRGGSGRGISSVLLCTTFPGPRHVRGPRAEHALRNGVLRGRLGGNRRYVRREAESRIRFFFLIGRHVRHDEALARAGKRPLQKTSEHGIPVRNMSISIRRRATPRERPKDVTQTKEASVDGACFPEAHVAGAWLRRARSIRPLGAGEVDERERAREAILAVVSI